MTIYFVGGEMGSFIPSDSAVAETSNGAFSYGWSSSFSRCAMQSPKDVNYCESPSIGSLTDAWVHFDLALGSSAYAGDGARFSWYDGGGTERIRLLGNNNGTLSMQYNVGAGWVTAGSSITTTIAESRQTIDIHVVCNTASGSIKMYLAGTERITSGTINLSAITALDKIRFTGKTVATTISAQTFATQVLVSDAVTIGKRVMTVPVTGVGANTAWTGSFDAVDEITYSDTDFIFSDTATQVETYTGTPISSLTGYNVAAVVVTARAKRDVTGPQSVQLALRSGGTEYFSSTKSLDVAYGAVLGIWETDPNTTLAWTNSAISSLQYGVKSIA